MKTLFQNNPGTCCNRTTSRYLRLLSPMLLALAGVLFLLLSLSSSTTTPVYAETALFTDSGQELGSGNSTAVAMGDLDLDGDIDAFVANGLRTEQSNKVWLNDGAGHFNESEQSLGDSISIDVALGDLDGDGDLDAFVANTSMTKPNGQPNKIWLNDGTGQFEDSGQSLGDSFSLDVALGDLDGDGDLDAFVANGYLSNNGPFFGGQSDRVWLNDGTAHFTASAQTLDETSLSTAVALGDVDGDGDLDAFVMAGVLKGFDLDPNNKVWLNNGHGTFSESEQSLPIPVFSRGVALEDIDGDGDLDAVMASFKVLVTINGRKIRYGEQYNQIWMNDGAGTFTDSGQRLGDSDSFMVALEDLDRDGDLDALVANGYLSGVLPLDQANKIWLNDGTGSFTESESLGDSISGGVALADLDGDGDLDGFVANLGHNKVWLNGSGHFYESSQSLGHSASYAVALGDLDGDGDLDGFVGNENPPNKVWLNSGRGIFTDSQSLGEGATHAVALGDLDGDGDLDGFIGNGGANKVWLNEATLPSEGNGLFTDSGQSLGGSETKGVALGDLDGDGDLDAFIGNNGANKVWLNDGNGQFIDSDQNFEDLNDSNGVALGDLDEDGDLDVFIGNDDAPNKVWLNHGDGIFFDSGQNFGNSLSLSVSLGDLDSDGDLDVFVANAGIEASTVWLNNGTGHFTNSGQSVGNSAAWAAPLGDIDGDGDLDVFMVNESVADGEPQQNTIWLNDGAGKFSNSNQSLGTGESHSAALGDLNGDGNLDVFVANGVENGEANQVYLSEVGGPTRFQVAVKKPGSTPDANFYSTVELLDQRTMDITYTLFDPHGTTMGRVAAFYSMDGGDNWQPALPTTDTITSNLASSPYPTTTLTNSHFFTWDTFASGFFGQSENVVLRLVAYPQPEATGMTSSYHYTNSLAGPYLWPYASATTFPFRVRGTQIRVYTDTITAGNEVSNAIVYRQPAGISSDVELMSNDAGQPFRSNLHGYLRGRGSLQIGDHLVALLPITVTDNYTLYHTSAMPTLTGLDRFTVITPGVQEMAVSAFNPLIIFDLDVSLEWDARQEDGFLEKLELNLERTSRFLYDWTNGQIALGKVRVYHAKENWLDSHIIIPASNSRQPNADLGGIVNEPLSETLSSGQVINDAYLPGQVRMAALWNRFGNPDDELGQDWPRTLAHELSHYLLFLPDNYLGSEDGRLIQTECPGSAMTDPYRDDYSEFLTRSEWTGDCERTLAHQHLDRADWETITTFYPMLNGSDENINQGPRTLPLNVTQVTFVEPERPANTLADPFFYVTDEDDIRLELPIGQAQGYLFKTQGTEELTDDVVMAIGSPLAEQLHAYGAESGDRLCLFDYSQTARRLGCLEEITNGSTNLALHEVPGWQPQITVDSVTSRTLAITVTQPISSGELYVQLLPAAHPTITGGMTSPMAAMIPVPESDTFTQTITLDYPIANGFVRVWVTEQPLREEITEFFISGGWESASADDAWGPRSHRYGWGVSRRHGWDAPISSPDGQVTILELEHIYGENPKYGLQSLSTLPNLPLWLTQVGQAYRFSAAEGLTGTLSIMFNYLQREVPNGREGNLWIAYSPDSQEAGSEGQNWQLLAPQLDSYHNLTSAIMPDEGIYTLISTIEMPPFEQGWNFMGYPVPETRAVATALASIDGYYTSVYHRNPSQSPEWRLYDQTVVENHPEFSTLVNDLTHLEFGDGYLIHATDAITLYLGVADRSTQMLQPSTLDPPVTFYGWITPSASFTATVGMTVTAWVNESECGETTVQELNNLLAYKIQVSADGYCDTGDITFQVGDQLMAQERPWDNSQAWYHSLPTNHQLYFPLIINHVILRENHTSHEFMPLN